MGADTEELDIPNFAGDLTPLMVEDSEDEVVVSDSDDDMIAEAKVGKTRGKIRCKTVIFRMPFEDHSLCISFCLTSFPAKLEDDLDELMLEKMSP